MKAAREQLHLLQEALAVVSDEREAWVEEAEARGRRE